MFRLRTVAIASTSCFVAGGLLGQTIKEGKMSVFNKQENDFKMKAPSLRVLPVVQASAAAPNVSHSAAGALVGQKPSSVAPSPSRVGEIMKFGFPGLDNIRNQSDYVVSYDRRTRNANWVFEHIGPDKLLNKDDEVVDRSKSQFTEDASLHPFFRATNEDYKNSGYDRGHLAAAGNYKHSQSSMDQTFLLSNIAPQVGKGFNRDAWNNLEKYVRAIARKNKNVYICTGPLYLPRKENNKLYVKYEVIGKNHVAVPTHFFKVVVIETQNGDFEQLSFVMPNMVLPETVKLKHYLVPIETIERAAGLLFFRQLPQNKLTAINRVKS